MEMNMREYSSFTIGHKIKVKEQRFMGRKLKLIVYLLKNATTEIYKKKYNSCNVVLNIRVHSGLVVHRKLRNKTM
jgi:hypothetical protein